MKRLLIVVVFLLVSAIGRPAQALPILGGQLFYTGGDVTVLGLPVSSGYTSELGFYNSSKVRLLYLMNDEPWGNSVTFNPGIGYGVAPGDELLFGIHVIDTGFDYFMGAASRNPDNVFHAQVDPQGGGSYIVGFEDLFGGGDLDYDDNRFSFTGGIQAQAVPEPLTLSLFGLGLLPIVRRLRRSR